MKPTSVVAGLALAIVVAGCASRAATSGTVSAVGSRPESSSANTSAPASSSPGTGSAGLWNVTFVQPPLTAVHPNGTSQETIVVNPDGTIDTYTFAGAVARAEYINTPGGVAEGTWAPDGKMSGTFDLSCSSSDAVVDTQPTPRHSKPLTVNLGVIPGACANGHMTALGYAKAFANNGHWTFVVVKAR